MNRILGGACGLPFQAGRKYNKHIKNNFDQSAYKETRRQDVSNLYHYTSVQGFESIIKNQCLRMTRSDFMNDPRDCQVFFDIVERYIEKISVDEISYSLNLNRRELVLKTVKQYPASDFLRFIVDNIPI